MSDIRLKQRIIFDIVRLLNSMPEEKVREVFDFVEFLSGKYEDKILSEGIEKISEESLREFLESEPDIYGYDDLKS